MAGTTNAKKRKATEPPTEPFPLSDNAAIDPTESNGEVIAVRRSTRSTKNNLGAARRSEDDTSLSAAPVAKKQKAQKAVPAGAAKNQRIPWTNKDDERLKELYINQNLPASKVAEMMGQGRTENSVSIRAGKLHLTKHKLGTWTAAENAILDDLIAKGKTEAEISAELPGRTEGAVRGQSQARRKAGLIGYLDRNRNVLEEIPKRYRPKKGNEEPALEEE